MATVTASGRSGASRARGGFVTPAAYGVAVLAIAALLLPSALRPPPDEATTTAELSPDAPPEDDAPDAIISAFQQAGSRGAGGELIEVAGPDGQPVVTTTTVQKRASRGACVGERQTESLYATTCAPGFVGDNGGKTADGVTGDEFRVAWLVGDTDRSPEGPVGDSPPEGRDEEDTERHARVYQTYFNQRYEFFGRRMRIVLVKTPLTGEAEGKAAAKYAKDQGVFAASTGSTVNAGALDELMRLKIVTWFATEQARPWYAKNHPYAYSFNMDAGRFVDFVGEMICKQLAGKPPSFNEEMDPLFDYKAPRKFGFVNYADATRSGSPEQMDSILKQCGSEITTTVQYNLYDNQQGASAAITKMRGEGVTTIIFGGDAITPAAFSNEAASSNYWPEWVHFMTLGHTNGSTQNYNPEQWRHAVAMTYLEIPRPSIEADYYRAYKSIEPGETPGGAGLFRELQMIANGVQGAGPKLTPETFWSGLQKMPRRAPDPIWSVGGAFGPNDFTYADYASLMYWDPDAQDTTEDLPGAFRYLYNGKRFALGELPTEPVPFFKPENTVVMAAEADAYWKQQGGG